jgi:hypothetical protein
LSGSRRSCLAGDVRRLIDDLPGALIDDATELIETLWAKLSAEDLVEVEAAHGTAIPARARAPLHAIKPLGARTRNCPVIVIGL